MKCPICQSELLEGAKFCPQCGAKVVGNEELNPALLDLVAQYERRLMQNPRDTSTRFNLALTHIQMKQWGAAIQQLELVCQQEPDFPDAWYLLAIAYHNIGRMERAKELLNEFVQRFPNHPKVAELRRRKFEGVDIPTSASSKLLSPKEGEGRDEIAG